MRGHIVKPTGKRKTWAIIYRGPSGAQQWEGKFKKSKDAEKRLTEVLGAIDKGSYTRPSSVTFEKFAEDWLAGRRKIRGSTESGYGSLINAQLVPRLGTIAVSALRFDHIDAAVSGMIEDELSSKTQRRDATLHNSRRQERPKRRRGMALLDPTLGLELPPLESRQVTPPTPEQVWALISFCRETRKRLLYKG